ncbi:unnamed protein product [Anisakis simplex]|uniref:TATA box-binding protein-like 1 n=1 Tax=Anisakis simplex TaxID=6269 RepID=A0A0M3JV59_ANISI|nr:unnamed protein product [Anisakis simplex]
MRRSYSDSTQSSFEGTPSSSAPTPSHSQSNNQIIEPNDTPNTSSAYFNYSHANDCNNNPTSNNSNDIHNSNNNSSFYLSIPLRELDDANNPRSATNALQCDATDDPNSNAIMSSSVINQSNHPNEALNPTSTELQPSSSSASNDQSSDIDIQIRNVVCSYTLPFHIDLRQVALSSSAVTFDRGRGVLLKQKRNPSCFAKIYSSGKVYLVGCRSEAECKRAARGVARMLQRSLLKTRYSIRMRNYRVCNVLATCKMPFGIRIEELAQKYPSESEYEPELSVGLVWRCTDPKATLRIHTTGSITVTGAVSELDVMRSIELIYPIVQEFKCAYRLRATDDKEAKALKKRMKRHIVGVNNNGVSNGLLNANKRKCITEQLAGGCSSRANNSPIPTKAVRESHSGAIGNLMYFSDEDDEEDF